MRTAKSEGLETVLHVAIGQLVICGVLISPLVICGLPSLAASEWFLPRSAHSLHLLPATWPKRQAFLQCPPHRLPPYPIPPHPSGRLKPRAVLHGQRLASKACMGQATLIIWRSISILCAATSCRSIIRSARLPPPPHCPGQISVSQHGSDVHGRQPEAVAPPVCPV